MRRAVLFAGKHHTVTPMTKDGVNHISLRKGTANGQSFLSGNMHEHIPTGVDVYVSTNPSRLMDDYIDLYKPVKTLVLPDEVTQRRRIAEGLKMIDQSKYDVIVITRCDMWADDRFGWPKIKEDFPSFLSYELANGIEELYLKDGQKGVSDIFWTIPVKYCDEIIKHLDKEGVPGHKQALHWLPAELPNIPFTVYYDEFVQSGTKWFVLLRLKTISQIQLHRWR